MFSTVLSFLALALPTTTLAANHGHLFNRHHAEVAKRVEGNISLYHRAPNAKWSYYDVQTGQASVLIPSSVLSLNSPLTEVLVAWFTTTVIL